MQELRDLLQRSKIFSKLSTDDTVQVVFGLLLAVPRRNVECFCADPKGQDVRSKRHRTSWILPCNNLPHGPESHTPALHDEHVESTSPRKDPLVNRVMFHWACAVGSRQPNFVGEQETTEEEKKKETETCGQPTQKRQRRRKQTDRREREKGDMGEERRLVTWNTDKPKELTQGARRGHAAESECLEKREKKQTKRVEESTNEKKKKKREQRAERFTSLVRVPTQSLHTSLVVTAHRRRRS